MNSNSVANLLEAVEDAERSGEFEDVDNLLFALLPTYVLDHSLGAVIRARNEAYRRTQERNGR